MKKRIEEKVVGFSSASLFPASKRETVTQGGIRGIDPDAEENPGSQYRQRPGGQARAYAHSRYIQVKQE